MKNTKKFLSILLSLIIAFAVCGCGETPDNTGANTGDNTDDKKQNNTTNTETSGNPLDDAVDIEDGEQWEIPQGSFSLSNNVLYVKRNSFITGPNATVPTTQWGLYGTDLGLCFYDDDIKRLYCSFGDNFSAANMGGTWNSNITLYTDNLNFTNGIQWQGVLAGQNGASKQVTPISSRVAANQGITASNDFSTSQTTTTIPTGSVVVDGVYYMFYMEVYEFLSTGEWEVFQNRVMKSTDRGQTWTRVAGLEWTSTNPNHTKGVAYNFGQIYPLLAKDGYVYIYGIPGGRSGGVKLGRVKKEDIENFEKYEYFRKLDNDGNPVWSKGSTGLEIINSLDSSYIVPPMCGELSVAYNEYLQRYIMVYQNGNQYIAFRRSPTPWGVWSNAESLVSKNEDNTLYCGLTHERLSTHNGKRIFIFVSVWTPEYNVSMYEVVFK